MTDLEKALEAEIEKLKAAISYIEDANERTAQALKAAEEMKAEHEQWRAQDSVTQQAQGQIEALQQRVATLEAREVPERLCTTPLNLLQPNQSLKPLAIGFALAGVSSLLLWRRKR